MRDLTFQILAILVNRIPSQPRVPENDYSVILALLVGQLTICVELPEPSCQSWVLTLTFGNV